METGLSYEEGDSRYLFYGSCPEGWDLLEHLEAAECELQNLKFEKEQLVTDLWFIKEEKGCLLLMAHDLETEVEIPGRDRRTYACRDFEVQAAR
ncbi:unnamed protein product [Caretta caretta]